MALPQLSLGNLTPTPIELKILERSKHNGAISDEIRGGILTNIARVFASFRKKFSYLSTAKPVNFSTQEISITIGPFETRSTDIPKLSHDILRITFEAEGLRYRIETPKKSSRSLILTPLSLDADLHFTAIHLPHASHISLFSAVSPEAWMSALRDDIPLSALCIPGTHNSPTSYMALPSVRCQAVGIRDQLQNGVRFLDVRVQPETPADPGQERLILVHGAFSISLTGPKYFRDLVHIIDGFLDANAGETVLLSLKREGVGKATDQQLSTILHRHYARPSTRWFTENRIPLLGEVRGKVVLIRRFGLDESLRNENRGSGWAIDAESWPDNCAHGVCESGDICVQDFYEVAQTSDIRRKIAYSIEQLEKSARANSDLDPAGPGTLKQPFFMNFLSASCFWSPSFWPDRVAAIVNPKIIDHLCRNYNPQMQSLDSKNVGNGCTGIVVCDWIGRKSDWDLVTCIIGMNARFHVR